MRQILQAIYQVDWITMIPVAILLILSLSTLFSIDPSFFKSQFIFVILSFVFLIFFSQINAGVLKSYAIPIYFVSLFLLLIILFLGIESRGSVRWLEIFGFRFQFSEILKPFLAISLSSFLSERRDYSFSTFAICFLALAPVAFLIFLQPDLGNALIYLGVLILALMAYGFSFKYFLAGFITWAATLPFFWLILHDYQRERILVFLNPSHDPLGKSYNAIQAIIAVGSGTFMGKGLGEGTQSVLRFLPEHHTDFIFATIAEEFGFIGALIIVFCFVFLLYRIYTIYLNQSNSFFQIFTIVAFFLIFVHFFINVGMNIGLVPVVGVTLPFVSYGGASLLSNFILLGLIFAINKSEKHRSVLEIK